MIQSSLATPEEFKTNRAMDMGTKIKFPNALKTMGTEIMKAQLLESGAYILTLAARE